jgi:hypothetical protein
VKQETSSFDGRVSQDTTHVTSVVVKPSEVTTSSPSESPVPSIARTSAPTLLSSKSAFFTLQRRGYPLPQYLDKVSVGDDIGGLFKYRILDDFVAVIEPHVPMHLASKHGLNPEVSGLLKPLP